MRWSSADQLTESDPTSQLQDPMWARRCASASRALDVFTSSKARAPPRKIPMWETNSSNSASGSTASTVKNSITPSTPRLLRIGNPNPAPRIRPGSPSPDRRTRFSEAAMNSACPIGSAACQTPVDTNVPLGWSSRSTWPSGQPVQSQTRSSACCMASSIVVAASATDAASFNQAENWSTPPRLRRHAGNDPSSHMASGQYPRLVFQQVRRHVRFRPVVAHQRRPTASITRFSVWLAT
jgi:hypothetical protein